MPAYQSDGLRRAACGSDSPTALESETVDRDITARGVVANIEQYVRSIQHKHK